MCSLPMKRYTFCITSTAYATNETTRMYHVYKPDFISLLSVVPHRCWDLFAIKSAGVHGLVFFRANGYV